MRGELAYVDWKGTPAGKTAEQQRENFCKTIREMQDRYIPNRNEFSNGRRTPAWLTSEATAKVTANHMEAKVTGKIEDSEAFTNLQKETKKVIRKKKMNYERKLATYLKNIRKAFLKC